MINIILLKKTLIANNRAIFKAKIPDFVEHVFVFFPRTRAKIQVDDFQGNKTIQLDPLAKNQKPRRTKMMVITSPDCNSNCDVTYSGTYSKLTVEDETACLTGTLNGKLTLKGSATIKICGTANLSNVVLINTSYPEIIVTTFGSLSAQSLNVGDAYLENHSSNFVVNGNLTFSSSFYNYGIAQLGGINFNSNTYLVNEGTMSVNNTMSVGGYFDNYGSFTCNGSINANEEIYNTCKLISNQSITINEDCYNYGYMKAASNFILNSAEITMNYGAMISTQDIILNGDITGGNTLSGIKVTGSSTINSQSTITGNLNYCDANGIETNNGTFGNEVAFCNGYIQMDGCNPEGMGYPTVADSDNDGIDDNNDDFPTDPTLAFVNHSPYTGYKTVLFEDLWPSMGDFDFNDLVIKTKITYKSNAQNVISKADVVVIISAVGASLSNGIGLQFLNDNNVAVSGLYSSVSGATIDPQESKSIKITNDVFTSQSSYYTNTSFQHSKVPDTLRFSIVFNSGQSYEAGDLTDDFYIFRSNNRGLEIHVANRPPTTAASSSSFGTFNDNSNPSIGAYYITSNYLPWGIELLDGNGAFRNPLEKVEITTAYPDFYNWASSQGSIKTSWFESPVQGKVINLQY